MPIVTLLGAVRFGLLCRHRAGAADVPGSATIPMAPCPGELVEVPEDADAADGALELVGRRHTRRDIEIPAGDAVVHDLAPDVEVRRQLVLDPAADGDAVVQSARLVEPLRCCHVRNA